ncbi:major facilitator superfamily domain-containing protein [Umbelopsis sp. PMI_123]|nr:major facilitator superfamily domain-containing protein [Umbelopsis sp. PMI_123]
MVVYGIIVPIIPFIILSIDKGQSPEDVDPNATPGQDAQVSQQTGVLLALFAAGILIGSPIFGYLGKVALVSEYINHMVRTFNIEWLYFIGDRLQRRQGSMLIGILGLIASTLLFMFSRYYYELLIARFLQGFSDSCVWILCLCLVADTFPKGELGLQMGKVMVCYSIGMTSGPPIGALYHQLGFKAPFIFCIVLAAIDFIMRVLIVERRRNPKEWFEDMDGAYAAQKKEVGTNENNSVVDSAHIPVPIAIDQESTVIEDATMVSAQPAVAIENKVSTLKLLSYTRMWGALILSFASAIFFGAIEPTLTLRLSDEWNYNTSQIGVVFLAQVLPGFISGPLAGHLSDKFGCKIVILPSLVITAAMCMLLGVPNRASTIGPLIVILVLEGFFSSMVLSPVLPEIAAVVALENKEDGESDGFAKSYALFNIALAGGMLIGPIIGGYIYSSIGFFWLNIILGIILLSCIPIVWLWTGVKGKLIVRQPSTKEPAEEPVAENQAEVLSMHDEKATT